MKHLWLTFLLAYFTSYAQQDTTIYSFPVAAPQFSGGDSALFLFFKEHIVYPKTCTDSAIQGKVYIKAVIEKDGAVGQAVVVKGVHPLLNAEALRVTAQLPAFIPALLHGQPVRSSFVFPVMFKVEVKQAPTAALPPPPVADSTFYALAVLSKVDVPPAFPGGIGTLTKYLDMCVSYPLLCRELNIQGTCTVGFDVETDGSVANIKILKGVHYELDNETVRVIKLLPDFKPAEINGKPVPCAVSLKISYTLACSADEGYMSNEDDNRLRYPGGFRAMAKAFMSLLHFPEGDLNIFDNNNRIIISFDVDTEGLATNPKLLQGYRSELDKEVLKAVSGLERFSTPVINGHKVGGKITLPVKFKKTTDREGKLTVAFDTDFQFGKVSNEREEYSFIDEYPYFDGYDKRQMEEVLRNRVIIPEEEKFNLQKGICYVRVFITETGDLLNVRVYKGVTDALDAEAVRVVKELANLTPARFMGRNCGYELIMRIDFRGL